jgi:hypothetical protein
LASSGLPLRLCPKHGKKESMKKFVVGTIATGLLLAANISLGADKDQSLQTEVVAWYLTALTVAEKAP